MKNMSIPGYVSPAEQQQRGHKNHMYPDVCSYCKSLTLHEVRKSDGRSWCRACGEDS